MRLPQSLLASRYVLGGLLTAALVALTALLAAAPSNAGTSPGADSTPVPCSTPGVDYQGIDASPREVDPGATVTVTVRYGTTGSGSAGACGVDARDFPVYARREGQTSFQQIGVVHTPAAQKEASGSLTDTPERTTEYALYEDGRQVVRVAVGMPGPRPSPALDECFAWPISLSTSTINATGAAEVTVRGAPGAAVDLLAYTRPSTEYRVVRSATTDASGLAGFTVRPPANTRLVARRHERCSGPPIDETNASVVLNVRTALTITAERNGTRDVTFAGDSLPARPGGLIVSLYRITDDGRQVLTSQARAGATDGQWSVRRRFTGSGRFGFVARTGQDLQNAPGASNVRSTLIY